jgi:hypothetical protein
MDKKRWADPGDLKSLHLPLASSSRLMRTLGPIVLAQPLLMARRQSDFGLCRAVRAKLIGHQHIGREAVFLEQLAHQFHRCGSIAPSLHEQVENLAFVVDCAPSQNCRPAIVTAISSRCHREVGRGRRRRSSRANNGPNFNTHRRTVS